MVDTPTTKPPSILFFATDGVARVRWTQVQKRRGGCNLRIAMAMAHVTSLPILHQRQRQAIRKTRQRAQCKGVERASGVTADVASADPTGVGLSASTPA